MLSHRPTRTRVVDVRWLSWGATVGTVVTASLAAAYWIFDAMFSSFEAMLWPTAIITMALEAGRPPLWTDIALVWAIAVLSNIALYTAVAALLSVVSYPIRRRSS